MQEKKRDAMAIEDILRWFDAEITDLRGQYESEALKRNPNKVVLMAIMGTVRYLDGMKAKLMEANLEAIDRKQTGGMVS
jgi:hypothetical protein